MYSDVLVIPNEVTVTEHYARPLDTIKPSRDTSMLLTAHFV